MNEKMKKTAVRFEPSLIDEIQCMMNEANATSMADFVRQATEFYIAELDSIDQAQTANPRVTKMVTLWVKLLGNMINTSYQNRRAKLNNQIDSRLRNKIEQKKKALGIKTDHTVKEVKNDDQDFAF